MIEETFDEMLIRKWTPILDVGDLDQHERLATARVLENFAVAMNSVAGLSNKAKRVVHISVSEMFKKDETWPDKYGGSDWVLL